MVHEYALEPELVATWGNRHDYRYFTEKFGLGQPRIVSRYPKRWRRLVWDALQSHGDIEKTRMTELVARLSERMVRRANHVWQPERTWIENAHEEHNRVPFRAILARSNAAGHPCTLIAKDLDTSTVLWMVPRGVTIGRSAGPMSTTVAAMLRIAQVVIFVDPYFRPGGSRHQRPLAAFLRAVLDARPVDGPQRIELHTALDRADAPSAEFFLRDCGDHLHRCVPPGLSLAVLRLRERTGGERLHNRYILTDVGGVVFGAGLDDGADGETDDVTLMDRAQYDLRWSQHANHPMTFDLPEARVEIAPQR